MTHKKNTEYLAPEIEIVMVDISEFCVVSYGSTRDFEEGNTASWFNWDGEE